MSSNAPRIELSVKSIVLAVSRLPYLKTEPCLQAGLAASQQWESRGIALQDSAIEVATVPVIPRYAHVPAGFECT